VIAPSVPRVLVAARRRERARQRDAKLLVLIPDRDASETGIDGVCRRHAAGGQQEAWRSCVDLDLVAVAAGDVPVVER